MIQEETTAVSVATFTCPTVKIYFIVIAPGSTLKVSVNLRSDVRWSALLCVGLFLASPANFIRTSRITIMSRMGTRARHVCSRKCTRRKCEHGEVTAKCSSNYRYALGENVYPVVEAYDYDGTCSINFLLRERYRFS